MHRLAGLLRPVLREDSLPGRCGSEAFRALVQVDDPRHAWVTSERPRRAVDTMPWIEAGTPVTVRVGVVLHEPGVTLETVLGAADARPGRDRATGRNRVEADDERDRQTELWLA